MNPYGFNPYRYIVVGTKVQLGVEKFIKKWVCVWTMCVPTIVSSIHRSCNKHVEDHGSLCNPNNHSLLRQDELKLNNGLESHVLTSVPLDFLVCLSFWGRLQCLTFCFTNFKSVTHSGLSLLLQPCRKLVQFSA